MALTEKQRQLMRDRLIQSGSLREQGTPMSTIDSVREKFKTAQNELNASNNTQKLKNDSFKARLFGAGGRFEERGKEVGSILERRGRELQEGGLKQDIISGAGGLLEVLGRGASFVSDVGVEAITSGFRTALPGQKEDVTEITPDAGLGEKAKELDKAQSLEGRVRTLGRQFASDPGIGPIFQKIGAGIAKLEEFEKENPELGAAARIGLTVAELTGVGKLTRKGAIATKNVTTRAGQEVTSFAESAVGKGVKAVEEVAEEGRKFVGEAVKSKPRTVEEIAGDIVQGKSSDRAKAAEALGEIDTSEVATFKDLSTKFNDRVEELSIKVDEILDENPISFVGDDLAKTNIVGGEEIKTNFVEIALDNLEELYLKSASPADATRIQQLKSKLSLEGLTLKEVNDLAREFGQARSGFNLSGTPSTSVTKQGFENVRTGLKDTVRDRLPNDLAKELDAKISSLITSRQLADDMVEKVNKLTQKVTSKNLVEKLAKGAVDTFNVLTLGGPRQIMFSLLGLRNQGFKTLNAIDLEKRLPKLLRELDELNGIVDEREFVDKLQDFLKGL